MKSITGEYELQIDEKSNGFTIRLNSDHCVLRICGIPRELVMNENDTIKDFIDITLPRPAPPKPENVSCDNCFYKENCSGCAPCTVCGFTYEEWRPKP